MSRITNYLAATVVALALASCGDSASGPTGPTGEPSLKQAPAEAKAAERAALLTNIPVSGPLSDDGSFTGTFTAQHIALLDRASHTFQVTGLLVGTATTAAGVEVPINQVVTGSATLDREANAAALRTVSMVTCDVLFLDLGPLALDLLGVTVDLSQVILDLNAVTGAGNLLGNLLCAVLSLLDGPGILASIGSILESINSILAGLSPGGTGGASFFLPGIGGSTVPAFLS
jgi:hypothetical protein